MLPSGCLANSGLLKRVVSPQRTGKMESVLFWLLWSVTLIELALLDGNGSPLLANNVHKNLTNEFWCSARAEPDLGLGGQIGRNVRSFGAFSSTQPRLPVTRDLDVQAAPCGWQTPCWGQMIE